MAATHGRRSCPQVHQRRTRRAPPGAPRIRHHALNNCRAIEPKFKQGMEAVNYERCHIYLSFFLSFCLSAGERQIHLHALNHYHAVGPTVKEGETVKERRRLNLTNVIIYICIYMYIYSRAPPGAQRIRLHALNKCRAIGPNS